jgi:hypothetical protein
MKESGGKRRERGRRKVKRRGEKRREAKRRSGGMKTRERICRKM